MFQSRSFSRRRITSAALRRRRPEVPSVESLESRLALSVTPAATNYITLQVNNNFDSSLLSKAAEYFGTTIDSSAVWLYANSYCGASTHLQYTRGTPALHNWTASSAVQLETTDGLIDQIFLPAGDSQYARIYAFVGTSTAPTGDPGPQKEATPYAVFEYSTPNTGSPWGNWVVDISYVDQISIPMQLSFNGTPQAIWGTGATQTADVQNAITDGFPTTTQVDGPQSGYLPILTAAQHATQGAGGIAIPADVRQVFQGFSTSSWNSNAQVEVLTPVTGAAPSAYRRVASNQYVNWQPATIVAADTQVFAASTPSYQSYLQYLYDNQPTDGYYLDYSGNTGFSFYLKIEESQIPLTPSGTFTTYDLVVDTIRVGTGQGNTGKYVINTGAGAPLGTNAGMRLVGNGTPCFYPTAGAQESVTSATANGTEITYYATNNFQQGQTVSISGMSPSSFNLQNQTIIHADANSFKVSNALSAQSSTHAGTATSAAWFVMNWVDYMAGAIGLPSQAIDGSQQWTGAPLSYTGDWAGQAATYSSTIWYTVSNAIASGMLSNADYVAAVSPTPTNGANGSSYMYTRWTLDQIRAGLYRGLLPGSDLPGIGRSYTDCYVNGLLAQTTSGFYYSAASDRFAAMGSDVQVWSPSPTSSQPAAGSVGTVTWDLGIQNTWGITGPGTATAGMTFQATVSATNGDVLTFTSSDPQAELPATGAFNSSSPQYPITLKTAGTQTVTVRDTAGHTGELTVVVAPGMAAQLGFVQQPQFTFAKRFFPQAVSVQVQDFYGNAVAQGGDLVSLAFKSANGATLMGTTKVNTDATGLALFPRTGATSGLRVSKPGSYALVASFSTLASATSSTFSVSRVGRLVLQAPATATQNSPFSITVKGTDTNFQGTVKFVANSGAQVLNSGTWVPLNGYTSTFTAADLGTRNFTVKLGTLGRNKLTVSTNLNAQFNGVDVVTVQPAAPTRRVRR